MRKYLHANVFKLGIIGGKNFGVAKKSRLISVKCLNSNGGGYYSDCIAGINWIIANRTRNAIVNVSLGGSTSAAFDAAIDNAINSGIQFVVSAGNFAEDACNYSPSSVTNALVVGASDENDNFATFSNYGSCVSIIAPGVEISSMLVH